MIKRLQEEKPQFRHIKLYGRLSPEAVRRIDDRVFKVTQPIIAMLQKWRSDSLNSTTIIG